MNYFEKFWRIFKFCANCFKNFKILKNSLMSKFFVEYPPLYQNFGDAIAVQYLREIHVWNSLWGSPHPPNQNPGAAIIC